ncbi:MAG TPA: ABC transporter permease [Methylomirabilota bacterium]|nr:ABC transporter permease [Methylomirabilota bacterium]
MWTYVGRRLIQLLPVLLGVSVLVFFGMHLIPGDVAVLLLGEKASEADLARLRHQLGLDQPVYVQYLRFLADALQGDFGVSLRTRQPVIWEIRQALPITIELSLAALLFAVLIGIAIGVLTARHPHSALDTGAMVFVLIGVSMPVFWTGILLLLVFGGLLGWLPLGGVLDTGMAIRRISGLPLLDAVLQGNWPAARSALEHLVLPAVTLGSALMATIARMARSTMLDVLNLDYVRTARAKGLPEGGVVARHALWNALLPVVTLIGLHLGLLLSGAVLTETIFALPGLGRLTITSVLARDYPVVQGVVVIGAVIFVLANLAVDVLYAWLDPRIRYS